MPNYDVKVHTTVPGGESESIGYATLHADTWHEAVCKVLIESACNRVADPDPGELYSVSVAVV